MGNYQFINLILARRNRGNISRGGNLKFVGLSWMNFRTDASMMPITPENSRFPRMTTRRDFFRLTAETATLAMLPGRSLAAEQNHRPYETTRGIQRGRPLRDLQQQFVDLRFGMFLHFNMATFQDRGWGDPTSSPELFHPTALDTDQWAAAAKSANMTWGCLTTRHHDGFCIWPTKTRGASVRQTSHQTDIVRAYVQSACGWVFIIRSSSCATTSATSTSRPTRFD